MARGTSTGGYTVGEVARLLGLPAAQIRSYVRANFLSPRRGRRGEYRFSLQDLVLVRTAKGLADRIPARRVRRALRKLKARLPSGRPLTGIRITAEGEDVVVREGESRWEADSGQGLLDFEVAELASRLAPLARRAAEAARNSEEPLAAEDWYNLACDLEPCDLDQARDAYRRALELEPEYPEARLNLGRLLHEAGHPDAAEAHYRMALKARPGDATASFNLGVALEDMNRIGEAIRAYEQALASDPDSADAHFNVARLYEREGRKASAFRHLKAYRALIRGR
jgi:tetratricopeptide (TPR) repeat protein